jgi:hypothetical protein
MNDDAKKRIVSYQQVFKHLPWQAFPFDDRTVYAHDDALIRDVLRRLRQLDPATPLPAVMESADTDLHYVLVGYDKDLVLYWFTYFIQEGDQGYMLYRINHFIDPSFNFMDYGHRFNLPETSMAKVYMDVFSRLNDWARLLELPYRFEVEVRDEYMGYQKNNDQAPILAKAKVYRVDKSSFWDRLWTGWGR